ncbi:MAG: hypothetical protein QOF16_207, partial [Actinomycetota bacterium]|nr:hypothetical protein [Actinomycetota bacterium]
VDAARREVKLQIAFYSTTRSYSGILERHGKESIVPELRDAFGKKDKERMIELIDDDLCDAIAAAGTKDEVADRVKEWHRVADRLLVAGPWYGVTSGRLMENYQAIVETFGSSAA